MYKLTCHICNNVFNHQFSHTKFCSNVCRKKFFSTLYGRKVLGGGKIPTGTVGAIAEMIVSSDLMIKGYDVFRSLSPSCYCDLIAIKGNKHIEVEVRTGYKGVNGKLFFAKGLRKTAQIYGIWERNSSEVTYLSQDMKEYKI